MTAVPPIAAIGLSLAVAGVLSLVLMILVAHGEREQAQEPVTDWEAES